VEGRIVFIFSTQKKKNMEQKKKTKKILLDFCGHARVNGALVYKFLLYTHIMCFKSQIRSIAPIYTHNFSF